MSGKDREKISQVGVWFLLDLQTTDPT